MSDKIKANDFEYLYAGKDKFNVLIKHWRISDFIITLEKRKNGSQLFGMDEFYQFYHPHKFNLMHRDAHVYRTFDEALLGALARKYDGSNSQAAEFMGKMLEIDSQTEFWR